MKRTLTVSAALLAGLVAAPVTWADGMEQLVAAAGLSPSEASGMSLTEIYAHKINRESGRDEKVTVSSRTISGFRASEYDQLVASAGLGMDEAQGMSLAEIAATKTNRGATRDERIPAPRQPVAASDAAAYPQLAASAGLTVEQARGMSLAEVYRLKQNGETGRDGWQRASK